MIRLYILIIYQVNKDKDDKDKIERSYYQLDILKNIFSIIWDVEVSEFHLKQYVTSPISPTLKVDKIKIDL